MITALQWVRNKHKNPHAGVWVLQQKVADVNASGESDWQDVPVEEESVKLKWCEHIELKYSQTAGFDRWFFQRQAIVKGWKQCPICGTPRP